MARNLKSYRKNDRSEKGEAQAGNAARSVSEQLSGDETADIQSMMNEYSGKSEAELMDELMRVTSNQKREGSFDAEGMRKTAASIMPMLTSEQQKKLMAIMNRLGG